jgi:hypothetical protein
MSTNLYWRRYAPVEKRSLPFALKKILGRHLWDHDGSLFGDWRLLGAEDVPFLYGVKAAGSEEVRKGVETLLDAIQHDGAVQVCIDE